MEAIAFSTGGESSTVSSLSGEITSWSTKPSDHPVLIPVDNHYPHGLLGAWRLDLATGTAWRSLRHDQIFGYPTLLPEWTYEMFLGHVLAEDRGAVDESYGNALSAKTDLDFTCRIRSKDGEVRWIWAKGKLELGERGEPVALYGFVQDITKHKEAEERIKHLNLSLIHI